MSSIDRTRSKTSDEKMAPGNGVNGKVQSVKPKKNRFGDVLNMFSLKRLRSFFTSRIFISTLKGVLAYSLLYVLFFLGAFQRLETFPITLTSGILITIAGTPGKSIGACMDAVFFGLFGVGIGGAAFALLAVLHSAPVAQGFIFWVFVYLMALLKSVSMRYFGTSLLAIIMAFSGLYVAKLTGGFSAAYLEDYVKSYCWGGAVALFVNFVVFPISAEHELRSLLITSLEHILTFGQLIAKSYDLTITEEERKVRDYLNQSIRADFGFLTQKLDESTLEINWSRWSMQDYNQWIQQTRSLQQSLITTYSSLVGTKARSIGESQLFKEKFLPTAEESFKPMRRDAELAIRDIMNELRVKKHTFLPRTYETYKDDHRSSPDADHHEVENPTAHDIESQLNPDPIATRLDRVVSKLREETELGDVEHDVDDEDVRAAGAGGGAGGSDTTAVASTPVSKFTTSFSLRSRTQSAKGAPATATTEDEAESVRASLKRVDHLQKTWGGFKDVNHSIIADLVASGSLIQDDDSLRVEEKSPSVRDMYPRESRGLGSALKTAQTEANLRGGVATSHPGADQTEKSQAEEEEKYELGDEALMRVYSMLFGFDQFVTSLSALHASVHRLTDAGKRPRKRLHFHLFERLRRPHRKQASGEDKDMHVKEAIALLEGREWVPPPKPNFWQRIESLEAIARSPRSVYAFKTACAVIVYATLLLAPSVTPFFISYGLTSGIIIIAVAMAPTLGQSLLTFVFQFCGFGLGSIVGMIILEIFHYAGGVTYNPVGITFLVALFAFPMCYVLYTRPAFFPFSLLGLNSCGTIIITEYLNRNNPNFDSPPYRAGKQLATMCIALGIAGCFQLLILRNPARKTLRKELARLIYSVSNLHVLLSAYLRAATPPEGEGRPPVAALMQVKKELIKRETRIQGKIISMMPLMKFASAEPQLARKFRADVNGKIIRASQIMLDRLREARSALGDGLDDSIYQNFLVTLSPYRRQAITFSTAMYFLCASSLYSKTPLPHTLVRTDRLIKDVHHDALVLSARLAKTDDGMRILKSQSFLRYWFYLLATTSVSGQLVTIEECIKELYGELEDKIA